MSGGISDIFARVGDLLSEAPGDKQKKRKSAEPTEADIEAPPNDTGDTAQEPEEGEADALDTDDELGGDDPQPDENPTGGEDGADDPAAADGDGMPDEGTEDGADAAGDDPTAGDEVPGDAALSDEEKLRRYRLMQDYQQLYSVADDLRTAVEELDLAGLSPRERALHEYLGDVLSDSIEKMTFVMKNEFVKYEYPKLLTIFMHLKITVLSVSGMARKFISATEQ